MVIIEIKWRNCPRKKQHERIGCETMEEARRIAANLLRYNRDDLVSLSLFKHGFAGKITEIFSREGE